MKDLFYRLAEKQQHQLHAALAQPLVPRTALSNLEKHLNSKLIKVIIGPRRAGKSTLVAQLLRGKSFVYFNFDEAELPRDINSEELLAALHRLNADPDFYFFDEIQNLPKWELFLNSIQRGRKNVIITGSNSNLLSRELASSLTGRHQSFELFPFSFTEYRQTLSKSDAAKHEVAFSKYLRMGGFPDVVLHPETGSGYLTSLFDAIVLRDVVTRYKLRQPQLFRNVAELLLSSVGSRYSANSVVRGLSSSISVPTAIRFINYGETAYLFRTLTRFSPKARTRINAERKIFTLDNGFLTAKKVAVSEDLSILLENAVFIELLRRGFEPNFSLFYYQAKSGYEVDFFLMPKNRAAELIQVCFSLRSEKTLARELRALVAAGQELRVEKFTIITMHENGEYREGGKLIEVTSASRWIAESGT